jgi:hypothetical protein
MPLLNQFRPFSDSWHFAFNSDVKQTMDCMGMHGMVVQDVGMHDMAVHYVAVHDVGVPGMAMPSVSFTKCELFPAVKN